MKTQYGGDLLNKREVGDRLGVGRDKVNKMIARGLLPVVWVDGLARFPSAGVDEFIRRGYRRAVWEGGL
jgi:excisionase family DNA binding protein